MVWDDEIGAARDCAEVCGKSRKGLSRVDCTLTAFWLLVTVNGEAEARLELSCSLPKGSLNGGGGSICLCRDVESIMKGERLPVDGASEFLTEDDNVFVLGGVRGGASRLAVLTTDFSRCCEEAFSIIVHCDCI